MMHPLIISGIISFFANLLIGLFVLSRNPRSRVNVLFAIFSMTVSGWSVGSFLENVIPNRDMALTVLRSNYLFGIWLPAVYLHFGYSFVPTTASRKNILRGAYLFSALLSTTIYTPFFIRDLRVLQVEPYRYLISSPGAIYYLFFLFFTVSVAEVLRTMLHEMIRSHGQRSIQFKYLAIANAIAIAAGFEYFSRVFGLFTSPPWDDYILVFYLLVLAYAIVRHQLLDIKVAVTRTGVLLGTYLVVLGVPFVVGWWGREWLQQQIGEEWWLVPLGLCTLLATVGPFAYAYLRRQAEERLLKEQRRYQRMLQHAARGMTRVRNLDTLTKLIVRVVSRAVRVQHASLFLFDKQNQRYVLKASHGPKRLAVQSWYRLEASHGLVRWLFDHRRVLNREELERTPDPLIDRELTNLGARLIVPGFIEDELIGFLALGDKLSGEAYSVDDLHAFSTLANEAAVAIENAKSYEELAKVNEQLRLAYDRLVQQERLAAAGQFAAGMAHEIKNPLTAIKTFAEYLPEKYHDPVFREKFFRIVQSEIDRINTLVKELLDFAKPAPLQAQPVPVSQLLDDTLILLSNQFLKQGVELRKSFHENGLTIHADPKQLKQVILNLLLNSLEAMPEGGRLEVSTSACDGRLVLRVVDSGCGIPEEHQAKLFDPFFTTKERGMGLGLAIVKGVVERHGGQIAVRSRPGQGTTVELSLPVPQG